MTCVQCMDSHVFGRKSDCTPPDMVEHLQPGIVHSQVSFSGQANAWFLPGLSPGFYQVYYQVFSQVPNPRFSWFSMITNAFP